MPEPTDEVIGFVDLPTLELESGRVLENVRQVYSRYGTPKPDGSNIVVICHALTGSHRVAGEPLAGQPQPWWEAVVGRHKAIDTDSFCVYCFNMIGSPYGSTSPLSVDPATGQPWGMDFPLFSVRDIVNAEKAALDRLGFPRIGAIVGGSLGGMQALEWAILYPDAVDRIVVIGAPAHLYPQAIAFNEVQRQAIFADPNWKNGRYQGGPVPAKGLAMARMLAMITYKSENCFTQRWMREVKNGDLGDWSGQFQVESYLHHHGEELVRRFDAGCYVYLTRAMDRHDIGAGRGGAEAALKRLAGKFLLAVGISSDMLFPTWQVEELADLAEKAGVNASYDEIESDEGHDAFLLDFDQVDDALRAFWERSGLTVRTC
ncbi:MAG: homoserine O-acetyltransferase [Synergistales bacterium]